MDNKTKRRPGDRADGRLLRTASPFLKFMPHVMPERSDACNLYETSFMVRNADKMLRKERVEGYKGIGLLHFIIAAYIRCLSMLPGVNRFISGRRLFARNGIEIIMMVKNEKSLDSEDTAIKIFFEPTDTIYDVYRKLNQKIEEVKLGDENSTADFADTASRLPRFLLKFLVWILKVADYFGILPKKLLDVSPFHGSMIITDTGSLKIGAIYHHIYNFGNLPVFVSFGAKYHKYEVNRHGEVEDNKYIDMKFTLDERIVDGHYYSQFFQALRYIFEHPEIVELPPSKVIDDIN